jgi:hypothetical protein
MPWMREFSFDEALTQNALGVYKRKDVRHSKSPAEKQAEAQLYLDQRDGIVRGTGDMKV